jgi:predicted dehydrogenase
MAIWINEPNRQNFHLKALHPHSVDIMRHYGGDVEAVQCFATKAPGRTLWSTAQINMRFKNGAVGHLTGSYDIERGHPMERCEVAGVNGRFVIDDMFREVILYLAGDLEKIVYTNPVFGGMGVSKIRALQPHPHFSEQVSQGVKPENIDGSGRTDWLACRKFSTPLSGRSKQKVLFTYEQNKNRCFVLLAHGHVASTARKCRISKIYI